MREWKQEERNWKVRKWGGKGGTGAGKRERRGKEGERMDNRTGKEEGGEGWVERTKKRRGLKRDG